MQSIEFYNAQEALILLSSFSWVVLIGFLMKHLTEKMKDKNKVNIIKIVFLIWAISTVTLSGINTYRYLANRSTYGKYFYIND